MVRRLACLALLLCLSVPASAQDLAQGGWFRLAAPEAAHWRLETPEPDRALLRRADAAGAPAARIVVVYAFRSSAYETALFEILRAFRLDGLDPLVEVVHVDGNWARAEAAIARAEADPAARKLVFGMGSRSAAFLHDSYRGGALPAVTVCAKDPVLLGQVEAYDRGGDANIAYTSLNLPIPVLLAELQRLVTGVARLAILVDRENVSAMLTQAEPLAEAARAAGLGAEIVAVDGGGAAVAAELATGMRAARARMGEARSMFVVTGSTAVFRELETVVAEAGTVPVVSMVPDLVRPGPVSATLSVGIGFATNARLAARYALEILHDRAEPGALPVGLVQPPEIAISFARARAIGLPVPFAFLERASDVYGPDGQAMRLDGLAAAAD
jgi:putative ABC transport system substrate-binding protein